MKKIISILLCISMLLGMAAFVGAAGTNEVTASKTVADLINEYGWTNSTTKQSFKLDDVVSVKINGGSNTGKAYDGDHIRIYATDSPAGTITISVADGYELVSVKISTKTGTYAYLCVDGTSDDISNKTTEVSGSSVVLKSVKNGSNGKQVRVTAIEVIYSGGEACDGTNHNFLDKSDEKHHWTECSCGAATDKIEHTSVNTDHEKFDTDNHWGICSCGELVNVIAHTYTNGVCVCGAQEAVPYLKEFKTDVAYKLGLYSTIKRVQYYATGAMNASKNYLMDTTATIADSADIYVETATDGYYLYFLNGETKTYIDIYANVSGSKTYINIRLVDEPGCVFTWSEKFFTFVTVLNDKEYCLGSHVNSSTPTLFSTTDVAEYLTEENMDDTQYVAHLICNHSWTDATCTTPKTCSICGATNGDVLGHSWKDATCTTPKTCSVCSATEGEANGHTRPEPEKVCINQNCKVCGENIPADKDHVTEVIPAVDATCTKTGLTVGKKCTICGTITVKQEEVPMLDHVPGDAATCTSDQTCKNCSYVFVEGGHKYDEHLTCTVCGDVTDHTHETEVRGAIAATCTKEGYTGDTYCKICDKLQKAGTVIPALGHTEVVDTGKAPTCTETGLTDGKHCSVCNTVTVKQEVIAAKGHTPGAAATCTTAQTCTVCDAVLDAAKGHTPGAAATCTTAQTCTVCDAVLTAATGHTFADGKCTVCEAADPDYVAPTEPETTEPAGDGNTTSSNVLADNGWDDKSLHESFNIGSNITVSVSATPVGEWSQNSGKFYTSDNTWRIYQSEDATVTIAAGTGKIVSVKVTYETKNDGVLTLNGKNIESGAVVEVDAASVVFGIANTGDKTNGQVKITGIEVVHTGPASSTPDATEPEATEPEATKPEATKPVTDGGEFDVVTKPAASEPFKFGMTQKNLENAVYYLKGGMDGYYMATTTDINEAIDVYLEETEGGFYLYTMVDGAKTYINMVVSGTHVNGAYEAAASTVYTLKNGTLVATVEVEGESAEYWFGTRNDKQYTTMGPCKTSYEGFYGQFYGTSNPDTADTFSSIVFALMALSAIGAGVVISKKKEF